MSRNNVRKHPARSIVDPATTPILPAATAGVQAVATTERSGLHARPATSTAASGHRPAREFVGTLNQVPQTVSSPTPAAIERLANASVGQHNLFVFPGLPTGVASGISVQSRAPTYAMGEVPQGSRSAELCRKHLAGKCSNRHCRYSHAPRPQTSMPYVYQVPQPIKNINMSSAGLPRPPLQPTNPQFQVQSNVNSQGRANAFNANALHIPSVANTPPVRSPSNKPLKENDAKESTTRSEGSVARRGSTSRCQVKADAAETGVDDIMRMSTVQIPEVDNAARGTPATSTISAPSSKLACEDPSNEVCRNYLADRCRDTRGCRRYHPPRYEWHKYIPKSNEVCEAYARGYCYLGDNCYRYHPPATSVADSTKSSHAAASEVKLRSDEDVQTGGQKPATDAGSVSSKRKGRRKKKQMENPLSSIRQVLPPVETKGVLIPENRKEKGKVVQVNMNNTKADSQTDASSSDGTEYYSMGSSNDNAASRAAASLASDGFSNKSASRRQARRMCIDFMHGHCTRTNCRFSHGSGDELERLLNMLTAPNRPPVLVNHATPSANPKPAPPKEDRPVIPAVPPGLGFNQLNRRDDPKPLREVWTVPVDQAQVTFGPGFDVKDIRTGFETRKILLRNVSSSLDSLAIQQILSPFGEVLDIQIPDPKPPTSMLVRAAYATHVEAAAAVTALDGARIGDRDITVQLATHKSTGLGKGVVSDGDICIVFPAPCKTGYVGYSTLERAEKAVAAICEQRKGDIRLHARRYEGLPKVGTYSVRILGLPPNFRVDELAEFKHDQGAMLDPTPSYKSLEDAAAELQTLLETFGDLISINILPPPFVRRNVRAWAHFSSPTAAENACKELHGRKRYFLSGGRLSVYHIMSVVYRLPSTVYNAIKQDLIALRARLCPGGSLCNMAFISPRAYQKPDAPFIVKLMAHELPLLNRLKAAMEDVLRGERVVHDGHEIWDSFFDRAEGSAFVRDIEQRYDMLINKDSRRRTICLFGTLDKRKAAREAIVSQVLFLRAQAVHMIPLDGRLIGLFMSEDLMKLQQEVGRENVELDLARKVLKVRGGDDVLHMTEDVLRRVKQRHVQERGKKANQCPVCFDEITLRSRPVTLGCGHSWCKDCLVNYMKATVDTRVFPIKCLGNEARCSHTISLETARDVLSPHDYASVARAAFLTYIHSKPSEFHYCPTPDCLQIYRRAPPDTVLQCPSCLVRICGNCHVEYHEGSFCPDRSTEDKKLFEDWTKKHDVKKCPGCNVTIERAAGCNHMTCTRCKTHICWDCLATFTKGEDVYAHMHSAHGNFGL